MRKNVSIKLPVTSKVFTCQDGRTDFWEYRDGDGLPLDADEILAALNEADALRAEAWCDGFNTRELGIQTERATLTAERDRLKEALRPYKHVCSECLSFEAEHNEDGYVDFMDERGTMICGKPKYPAKEALIDDD